MNKFPEELLRTLGRGVAYTRHFIDATSYEIVFKEKATSNNKALCDINILIEVLLLKNFALEKSTQGCCVIRKWILKEFGIKCSREEKTKSQELAPWKSENIYDSLWNELSILSIFLDIFSSRGIKQCFLYTAGLQLKKTISYSQFQIPLASTEAVRNPSNYWTVKYKCQGNIIAGLQNLYLSPECITKMFHI